jgi:hypothetical protein
MKRNRNFRNFIPLSQERQRAMAQREVEGARAIADRNLRQRQRAAIKCRTEFIGPTPRKT